MEHAILGVILLIVVALLVTGLRILQLVTREVGATMAMAQATLDAVSKLQKQQP